MFKKNSGNVKGESRNKREFVLSCLIEFDYFVLNEMMINKKFVSLDFFILFSFA